MKHLKRYLVIALCIFLMLPTVASYADIWSDPWGDLEGDTPAEPLTFSISAGEATVISSAQSVSGVLEIPSTYDGYPVTKIGYHAFQNRINLTEVIIPDSVLVIDTEAFQGCTYLEKVTLPDSLTTIGPRAFVFCAGLSQISVPKNVSSIGQGAFDDCRELRQIAVSAENPYYSSDSYGVLFNKNKTVLVRAPEKIEDAYFIPSSVKEIGLGAFAHCYYLGYVNIPNGVQIIGGSAFSLCQFAEVTIPESVITIGECAFSGCKYLTAIVIPRSVASIEAQAFYNCSNLETVAFIGSACTIGGEAFFGVTANACYPDHDPTWTDEVKQNYGGTITWNPHTGVFTSNADKTCTQDGTMTGVCTYCNHQVTVTDPATGHSFVDGICGVCGEADPNYVPAVVIPTLTLNAPTLEFKDMITVNAMFTAENIEDVVEMGMITYTENVSEWSVETANHVIPGTTYDVNTGRYIASSQGIHAKYLGDTVYLACYAKLTDGSYVYTKLAPYSPAQYAASKLNGSDVALKQLVVAMLNYGAAAQTHFNHNVENLANTSLTAEQMALPEAYRSDMVSTVASPSAEKQGAFVNNSGFAKRYPSISFEGAFCINYFFTPNYAPVDGITLYYWNAADFEAADVLSVENASGSFKLAGEGTAEYRGDITGIAAKNLSEAVYVAAVYENNGTTWTSGVLGYSIGAYCASQSTKGGTIADLAMATAVYGYQAKQYFG